MNWPHAALPCAAAEPSGPAASLVLQDRVLGARPVVGRVTEGGEQGRQVLVPGRSAKLHWVLAGDVEGDVFARVWLDRALHDKLGEVLAGDAPGLRGVVHHDVVDPHEQLALP